MNEKAKTVQRVVLFVGLTWLVLFLTPVLFRGPVQPVTPPDTTAGAAVAPNVAANVQPGIGAAAPPTPVVPAAPDSATVSTPAIPVQSVSVSTPVSNWVFSSQGATAVGVELLRFRELSSDSGNVRMLRDGEPLLRYSLVTAGDTLDLSTLVFATEVDSSSNGVNRIRFSSALSTGARISFAYTFAPDSYVVRVSGTVEGTTSPAFLLTQLPTGLRSGEADATEDLRHYAIAFKPAQEDARGIAFAKMDPGKREIIGNEDGALSWVALKSKYFILGLLKPEGSPGFVELQAVGGPRRTKAATDMITNVIDDVSQGSFAFDIYAGPQEFTRLTALGRDFQNSNPYGGFLQPVVQPFATIVMQALLGLKHTTGLNYGWVLVIFGVLIRLLLWPLNQKAMRTSLRMQRVQPELQELQTKYKSNPQKLQEEMMRVYKSHGMTPFSPLAGCLPMLIPMPILFALFFVFQNTIEFRGVPFLWLPDISQKDPFYIIPVFMGASMFLMSWLGSRGVPQNPQTKMMMYLLPGMFTVLFLNFASGLNLYYAVQNIAALPQQWLIAREKGKAATPVVQDRKPSPTPPAQKHISSSPRKKGKT